MVRRDDSRCCYGNRNKTTERLGEWKRFATMNQDDYGTSVTEEFTASIF